MATIDFQTGSPATLPPGTKVKFHTVGGENVEAISVGWGNEGSFSFVAPLSPFPCAIYDAAGVQITNFGGTAGLVNGDHTVLANTTNAKLIAAGSKKLRAIRVSNITDAPFYVKTHNVGVTPTPGVGVNHTYMVQAGEARDIPIMGGGLSFPTGIGVTVTAGLADADTTALPLNPSGVLEVEYE